ncbi:RAVE protein 1 C terminal-domain-containing protein [Panaeolus papilionaceus]|nr:RAVE protein 1 C terminal-domain-containing protein [Panaeolus papilionaceus]
MLELQQTCTGYPHAGVQHLLLPNKSLLLYPFAHAVVILDAHTLSLVRVLAFWEAYAGLIHSTHNISCISVDSGMKLIVAASTHRLAAWSLSDVRQDTWRVHSSLVLPEDHVVTSLDNKAGLLAVGCSNSLSVYTLVLENDLPTWSKKWEINTSTPTGLNFAPSLTYIASISKEDNALRLFSTTSGRRTQVISHPRPVIKMSWRRSPASSRDDLILYTITSDATLRIFFPVLDAPDYFQLHGSLDLFSSLPYSVASQMDSTLSSVFWIDRKILEEPVIRLLKQAAGTDDARTRRIKEIKDENWDLFIRILADGSVVVTAVANLDHRPPTLLQQFTLQQSQPSMFDSPPSYLYILPNPNPNLLTLITSPPLMSMDLSPLEFFDARSQGLKRNAVCPQSAPHEESEVVRFIRTPEGNGVGAVKVSGIEIWRITDHGSKLTQCGQDARADFVVALAKGDQFVTYNKRCSTLKLHSDPPQKLVINDLESLFTMPSSSGYEHVLAITKDLEIVQILVTDTLSMTIQGRHYLPLASKPRFILPVDPMAWDYTRDWTEHNVLLSISEEGELAFWVPGKKNEQKWTCTGTVKTGRTGFRKVRCSSARKTALIVDGSSGDELTIWDSSESEFASGLEYSGHFSDTILDLDWNSTPDMQSILAVGYAHRVDILCQQRMTYFTESPGWGLCRTIDISSFTPYPISDSIWLAHGSLLVAAGPQMYLYSEPPANKRLPESESLFEYVARQNGPLVDYHPQMLLQSLLWDKVKLVQDIILNLARALLKDDVASASIVDRVPVEDFLQHSTIFNVPKTKKYNSLFNGIIPMDESPKEIVFNRPTITRLIAALEATPLSNLTHNEQAHLIVLIQTTLEIDEQRRALDSNGLRYLISMRSFFIINHRAGTPLSKENGTKIRTHSSRRERLRYRDMIWAFHSESQELLLNASSAAFNNKMTWSDARALGIPLWLNSLESLRTLFETIAKNEYMAGENRDPTACSLFYFALGKSKLVHGLWRQAAWHKEQGAMLKFLNNDFTVPRWKTAALKNAFALLGKQRFEYAAAFFLLGGSVKDAVNVCIRQLGDFQLAIAIARLSELSNEGPLMKEILSNTVLPIAFELGNRWLGSWAFWLLHRRDLAVRILLTPLQDIAAAFDISVNQIGEPQYDDPSLALLFSQLRTKTLQAAKGTSEISGRSETNFVLQMARVFCRMGCHALALDLVRSWSFARPTSTIQLPPEPPSPIESKQVASPTPSRAFFALHPTVKRRSSILIDMDVTTLPSTSHASPAEDAFKPHEVTTIKEETDVFARKVGIENLMKSAKQDVQVPEFDMNAFF